MRQGVCNRGTTEKALGYVATAGTGLFTAAENGWEIQWSLFEFPNYFHREQIVYELLIIISTMGKLL